MFVEGRYVEEVLTLLSRFNRDWLLLRNSQDELPSNLKTGKDIDVLLRYDDRKLIHAYLYDNGFRMIPHPLRNDTLLYGVHPFEMYASRKGVLVDVNYEIAVRSIDEGQWIPLDQEIQTSAFENRRIVELAGIQCPMLSDEDLFVSEIARQVFVKRSVSPWHQEFFTNLYPLLCMDSLLSKLELVFFAYAKRLLQRVDSGDFEEIFNDYLAFSDY